MLLQFSTTMTRPASAIAALATGVIVAFSGAWRDQPPVTVTGLCLTVVSLTLITLNTVKSWITDTSAERAQLLTSVRHADETRGQYIAAQSALTSERDRMRRDADFETARCRALLTTERTKLADDFEAQRAELVCQTFESAFKMIKNGVLTAPRRGSRAVIPFPSPTPQPDGQAARGVSHP